MKRKRTELFNKAFNHISDNIDGTYKDLTRNPSFPLGGKAYLDMEDSTEPYNAGLKYHAMPPLKRFRDMEHLSGGEKTIAALALLFAIHSYQPSPFFVLDEVDAALDNVNVGRVAKYVREHASPGMQFIVISLKAGFFQESESLVGVMRDQARMSSRVVSLDVSCSSDEMLVDLREDANVLTAEKISTLITEMGNKCLHCPQTGRRTTVRSTMVAWVALGRALNEMAIHSKPEFSVCIQYHCLRMIDTLNSMMVRTS